MARSNIDNQNRDRRGLASADPDTRKRVARAGGQATAKSHGSQFYHEIGRAGGNARKRQMRKQGESYQDLGQRGGETTADEFKETGFYEVIGHLGGSKKGGKNR